MPDLFEMSAPDVNQATYVAIAFVKEDPQLDILAGITYYMLLQRPDLPTEEIHEAINQLQEAIKTNSPDRQFDRSPNDSLYMSRILTRLVPAITNENLQDGAKDYTRAFYNSYRRGIDPFRKVAAIETQIDQFGQVDRFRRDTWEKLYELAVQHPVMASAINQSPIAEGLGIQTTQDAKAILETVPIPPLESFLSDHLQSEGQLSAPLADVEAVIDNLSNSALDLSGAYAQNLFELNRVEQEAKDSILITILKGLLGDQKEEEETELEKAIKKAEEKQKELNELLGDVRSAVKGTLEVFAFLAARSNDEGFAEDIKKFSEVSLALLDGLRKYSKGAIDTAKKISGLLSLGATGFTVIGAVGLTVGLIAIGIKIFGMFGKQQTPSINERILQQLQKISIQIRDLRQEMNVRFDRIEKQLNKMFESIIEQFNRINFELGQIEGNIEEIQFSLYSLHSELQRLNRNIHTFLEAEGRRDLVEAINGFLNFRERTGQDLDFETFLEAENEFFSWSFSHSKDPLQAGPPDRSFQDSGLLTELNNFPLATNINFLSEIPSERFSLPPLSESRLANPLDWITASEGYAQLSEEWQDHSANISSDRAGNLIKVGELLSASLSKIANNDLFNRLAEHYKTQFSLLKEEVAAFEVSFRSDPATGLHGIDLWGGANQVPGSHYLAKPQELGRCDNKPFDAHIDTLTIDLPSFDHSELAPYMVAHNLGLDELKGCVVANWIKKSVEPIFGERFHVTFQLIISVEIQYGGSKIFVHRLDSDSTFTKVLLRRELDTFDPNGFSDPYLSVAKLENKLLTFPASHTLINPSLRTATMAAVEARLKLVQRAFYAQVAERLVQAGDPIQLAGERLTGSKLLWQSFITMGLPLSVEGNDFFRALLFGSEAILAGTDVDSQDGLLDDFQDIYTFFSTQEDPPSSNIITDIEALVNKRVERLTTTLADIVENINTTGEPEPPELFAPTLLRLRLIESRDA